MEINASHYILYNTQEKKIGKSHRFEFNKNGNLFKSIYKFCKQISNKSDDSLNIFDELNKSQKFYKTNLLNFYMTQEIESIFEIIKFFVNDDSASKSISINHTNNKRDTFIYLHSCAYHLEAGNYEEVFSLIQKLSSLSVSVGTPCPPRPPAPRRGRPAQRMCPEAAGPSASTSPTSSARWWVRPRSAGL